MADQPDTGVDTLSKAGYSYDTNRIRRGGQVVVLMRDYNGCHTDISPGKFSPFAKDGKLRKDLKEDGWHVVRAISQDGVSRAPNVDADKLHFLQSEFPARVDVQTWEKTISFTPIESTPITDALQKNRKLGDAGNVGDKDYGLGTPAMSELVERQVLIIRVDKAGGKTEFTAEGYARVTWSDVGEATMSRTDPDAAEITLDVLLDPYFVAKDGEPIFDYVWRDGDGWRADDSECDDALDFDNSVEAEAGDDAGTATLTVDKASGGREPRSYVGQYKTDESGARWKQATTSVDSDDDDDEVKLKFVDLPAGDVKLRAKVIDAGEKSAVSKSSESVEIAEDESE